MEKINYKEKYEQALERAKEQAIDGYLDAVAVNDIFPELVESFDEKIRKAISQCVKDMRGQFEKLYRVHHKDAIAWLEKQAEQKHTAEEVLIKAGLKPYKDGDQWCVLLGDNIQEGICGFGNTIEDALYAFLKDLIASQDEQKPAWSEEDEATFTVIGSLILDNFSAEDASKTLTWLHSLRPQPKQEWSYNDEIIIETIIQEIEKIPSEKFIDNAKYRCLDWLRYRTKSLKPHPQWKPSEGQLECLGYAIDKAEKGYSPLTNNRIYLTLKSLKEQLEKL